MGRWNSTFDGLSMSRTGPLLDFISNVTIHWYMKTILDATHIFKHGVIFT